MYCGRHITVIIPALDEEPSIARVLEELFQLQSCPDCGQLLANDSAEGVNKTNSGSTNNRQAPVCSCEQTHKTRLIDRIIVCDNGSSDNTAAIAEDCGAMVTHEPNRGYGAACLAALLVPVEKDLVVFVDADHSVVAAELPALLDPLYEGADLVIGSRTLGNTEKGALSLPQRFGNQLASALIRLLWSSAVTDLGPFRAIKNSALIDLEMSDRRFGWTVEMQVRALQLSKTVVEVPVSTRCRIGKSKIGGTFKGVIGAAHGILGTIARLYWKGLKTPSSQVSIKRY